MSAAVTAPAPRARDRDTARRLLAVGAFAVVTAALVVAAYYRMFYGYGLYDDEGYLLVGLRSFHDGGALYSDVYSQYGPMYFEALTGLCALLGLDLVPGNGRWVTLGLFVVTCSACGFAMFRLTSSLLIGICVEVLTFKALFELRGESLSAGDVTTAFLAGVAIFAAVAARRPRLGLAGIGALAAAAALVKINVGGFALISCVFALVLAVPALARRRWLRMVVAAGFVATPFLVTGRQLGVSAVRELAVVVGLSALALALAVASVRRSADDAHAAGEGSWVWALAVGATVVTVVSLGVALLRGSSPYDLLEGILRDPLRHPDVLVLYVRFPWWAIGWAVAALVVATAVRRGWRRGRIRGGTLSTGLARLVVGLALWAVVADIVPGADIPRGSALSFGLPLAWVAAVPVGGAAPPPPAQHFARILLPALAVLQGLHAYPIASHQLSWSLFLLVPVGAMCVADGLVELRECDRVAADVRRTRIALIVGAVTLLGVVGVRGLAQPARDARNGYRRSESLRLPGTNRIRVPTRQAVVYRRLTRRIDDRCASFITYPGLASLHLFTGKPAPTGQNATAWMYLFDEKRQRREVDDIRGIRRLCVVRFNLGIDFWRQGRPVPQLALVRYIDRNFVAVSDEDAYEILVRRGR